MSWNPFKKKREFIQWHPVFKGSLKEQVMRRMRDYDRLKQHLCEDMTRASGIEHVVPWPGGEDELFDPTPFMEALHHYETKQHLIMELIYPIREN